MKKEARELLYRSIDSLFHSVEQFNRPYDRGRPEAVLIFIDRAFELLLKAIIVEKGVSIYDRKRKQVLGLTDCLRKCVSDASIKCINEEEALTIQSINSLRDAAQHYILSVSEQQLYMYAQAGVTIFKRLLQEEMKQALDEHLPQRVLPITTQPPSDLAGVISAEFDDVKALLKPGARKRLEARAKLRTLAILETSIGGTRSYPTEAEISGYEKQIKRGANWNDLFPGIASLRLDTEGTGLTVSLKITKSEGEPIKLVSEGDPSAMVVAVKRVNELDYYSLTAKQMAKKLRITVPKFAKLGVYLGLKQDPEYYKEWKRNSSTFYGYSPKALDLCQKTLAKKSIDEIWALTLPK